MPSIRPCKQCGQPFEGNTTAKYCSVDCFKQMEREYSRRVRKTWSKDKRNSHLKVYEAVNRGTLIKQPCEVCGNDYVVAHHDDYAKPLDVRWLCLNHHQQWHRKHGSGANA